MNQGMLLSSQSSSFALPILAGMATLPQTNAKPEKNHLQTAVILNQDYSIEGVLDSIGAIVETPSNA